MISFSCDYLEGAHPKILERLIETNLVQTEGYEEDSYCDEARDIIRKLSGNHESKIYFFSGGTQTNFTIICHILRPWQAVVSVDTGHIATHETGAIESRGHKIITVPSKDGKLSPRMIDNVLKEHTDHHMVEPKLVYISNSTEIGTIYSKEELVLLSDFCKQHKLYLFLDGARLAQALTAKENNLNFRDIANLCDVYYIGGTKCGALFGEALVFSNPNLAEGFEYTLKQCGALFAKGRVLGIQFAELLKDTLYFDLGLHANKMANCLRELFALYNIPMYINSPTNQLFPILPNHLILRLRKNYSFRDWVAYSEDRTVVRFVTSWATTIDMIDSFRKDFISYINE